MHSRHARAHTHTAQTLLPRVLQMRSVRTEAPLPAILSSSAVTVVFVCMSDFTAVLGVDMLLYAAVLTVEICSLWVLRFANRREAGHLGEGFRIPLGGPFLALFFLPCLTVCGYIFYVTPSASFIVAGFMVYIGVCIFVSVYLLRRSYPDYFQQIATALPALLETPACSHLNTPAPSVHGEASH